MDTLINSQTADAMARAARIKYLEGSSRRKQKAFRIGFGAHGGNDLTSVACYGKLGGGKRRRNDTPVVSTSTSSDKAHLRHKLTQIYIGKFRHG